MSHPISCRSILVSFSPLRLGLPSGPSPLGFPIKPCVHVLLSLPISFQMWSHILKHLTVLFSPHYHVTVAQTEKSVSNKPHRSLWPIRLVPNYFCPSDYYTKVTECIVICHRHAYVSNPVKGVDRARVFRKVEPPRFKDSQNMKVVRLLALRTGRLYPLGNILGTHFC
jgi:hypothetical protein